MKTYAFVSAGALLIGASAHAQTSAVDGVLENDFSDTLMSGAVQNTSTSFGDNDNPDPGLAIGSELNFGLASISNGNLYIFLGGNLETNFNKLEIFVDCRDGGQNRLRGDNADVDFDGLNRLGDDGSGNGMTFDAGFNPDMWLTITCGVDGDGAMEFFASYGELRTEGGGYGGYLGMGGSGAEGALVSAKGMSIGIDNSNIGGVSGGTGIDCGSDGDPEGETGIELAIPLYLFDWDGEGLQIDSASVCAMINSSGHDSVSNQVLGGIFSGDSLGDPRDIDFNAIAGSQYFQSGAKAEPCPGVLGSCCVVSGESVSCLTVPAAICDFYGGDYGGDGSTCDVDSCEPPVQCESDINGDGRVDVGDLLKVIADWGCIE
tara:strand:+ start:41 stop:1165 length:1125 start_codon:yes stop_codon:yes gene_type:complete